MKYSNTVEYNISTKLDASGLTKLQSQIKQVELSLQRMGDKEFLNPSRVAEARKQLEGLDTALTRSFNSSLGILDLSKLRSELQASKVTADGLGIAFNMAGSQGTAAMTGLIQQIGNFNGGIERTSSTIDKMFVTFQNTFRWGMISSFFSQFMNAIHSSVDYVKELDDSLTQIMLVTDYNRDSMNEYAKSANEAAKALSMSTAGMTNASLVFAQQGYDLNQSQELATLSAKVANASQQDTATTSDQITAYMNAYGLEGSISELTQAMDNWALIANISAADVSELAQASQRAASMANAVGVSGEALAAQIATIESVTREAPEQIGNGLKTLYARFSDISLGGEDEDGIGLGKVTATLEGIGVKVLDQFGNIRTMDDIMEDLMVIWDDLDSTTKTAAAQALAGKYQVNRFEALMENSDMYRQYKNATGENATGTLDQMNQEYAESLAGRTQKLSTTLEGLFNDVFTTDMVYPLIDRLTDLANAADTVFKAIGDGPTILLTLASAFGQLFSTNIARAANDFIANQQLQEVRKNNIANVGNTLDQLGLGETEMGQYIKTMASNAPKMNQDQYDQYIAALQDWSNTTIQLSAKEEELQGTLDVLNMVYGTKLKTPSAVNKDDETGKISFTEAEEARANLSNKQLTALASKEDFVEETQQIMSLSKELGKAQIAYGNFKSGIVDADEALRMFDLASDQVGQQLENLKEAGILSEASFDQLDETFKQVTNGLITGTDDIDQLEQELDELIRRFANLGEAASSMDPNTFKRWILSGIEQAKKQEQELQGIKAQDEQNKKNAGGIIDNIISQNAIEGVIKVTSSLGQLAGAISTVQNLGQILTDDSLGPMEKFTQLLTGIGIIIPTVITSIKAMSDGIKMLQEAHTLENIALTANHVLEIAGLKIKQKNIIQNIENATSMKAEVIAAAELAAANTALATAETTAGIGASKLAAGLASIWSALGPIGIAIIGLTAILGGSALKYLWDEAKEAEAQQKALNELTDQTTETVSKLNETAPVLNELYDAYKQTGEASDEFKQSLESQAELLGINDAALLISQGKYEDLKAKIDEATEAIYNNNAALQQAKLDKINPNEMVNELTDDQKERYNVTYHQEEGITGITGGTATKGQVNKLDQTPYELVKAAQQDIEKQQERINSLTQERNNLVKEGLTATTEASQKIASDITKVDEELAIAAQKLAESKEFTENHSDILEATEAIRDNALNQELNNSGSIFKTGTYEEIKNFISAQQGVNSSNVDELIQKYADLTGNIDAATEATLKLRDQQIRNNELIIDDQTGINYRAGEKGKFLIDEIGKQQDWSNEDKAKISSMIDWTDPDVDQKVIELLERIQQGLNDGLSLDEALKIENPEDIKAAIAEMEPRDSDLEVGPYREMAEYLREFAGELEGIPEEVGQNSEMLQDFTEAILRYDDAIQDADENLSDWKDILLNTGEAAEDDAVYLEDLMEAFEGMRDMIGDLLDMDVSDLSQQFMQNSDVLDILDKAIYGVGEEADLAYDQLNYLAQLDMAGLIDWTDGIDEELADWDNALPSLEANMDSLSARATELGDNASYAMGVVQDILGGSIPGPDLDLSAFIAGLEQMVNDGEMSVAQAMAAIDGAGYSAEVTQGEAEGTNEEGHINAIPHLTEGVTVNSQITGTVSGNAGGGAGAAALKAALGGGGTQTVSWQGQVQGVEWTMEEAKEQTATTANATGVKYKANTGGGSGAGQIHFTNVKAKPTGSTKRNTSGNGNHSRPSSGGGGGGKSCFIAGTLISTSFGYKPIELVKPNDLVLSYNKLLHQNEYSKVIQTMIHDTIEPIYTLYIKNEQLRVTGIHRFLVSKDINFEPQWIAAQDLQIGDWVLLADNTWHLIWKIEINLERQIVYNFEVAGNHNYYVGCNQILAHNKGGSGKKGGGSGNDQKLKTAKKKEPEKAEKKYYEEVDKQLKQTEKTLKSLEKVTDKLTGTQARAKQNEQLKLLQKEKDLQEKKLKILQEQEKVDVSSAIKKADKDFEDLLKKQGVNFNLLDFTFDEEGFIDNLDSVRESIANGINKLNDQYNAIIGDDGEVTDEEQERLKALDEEIQKLEKIGKEVEKNGTRYNEIVIEEQEIQDEMQEIQDQMQDIAIDAYKASQEAIDNLKDLRKEWAKFSAGLYDSSKGESFLSLDNPIRQLKEIENEISSIYAVSGTEARKYYDDVIAQQQKYLENAKTADEQQAYKDAIEYYEKLRDSIDDGAVLNNGLMQLALNDLTRLQEIWNNWNDEGGNGFFGDDKASLEKALEDAQKRVMEFVQDFEELIEDLKDASLDVVDHTMEQWDRQLDRYDRVIDQLDRYSDTYSLIYGDASYDMQEAVLSQQAQTLKSELDAAQEAYLAANTYYLEAYEKFVDKSTGLAKEGYEDYMYELEEAMNDAEDKVRDIAADAAEKWADAFEAAVKNSTQVILQNTIGENNFDHLDRNWEWDREYIDKYRDDVEKAYELDKLRSRYMDMLNNAQGASLQTQNKIRAQMQEQLDLLNNQTTVSEYDVKLANAKLEILQKQIALEDAQRNKNKMQLRRDTQGNYRYVYTADKDSVDQAQQELLDSEYDAYEMSKQQQMNNYDDMINAYKRYLSQREEILTNNNLSEAQKIEQIKELWDRFQKYVNAAQEDFKDATAGTVDILQWLVVNGTDYTATAASDMLQRLVDHEGNVVEQSGIMWMDLANNMADNVIPKIEDAIIEADDHIISKMQETHDALVGNDGSSGLLAEVSGGANNFGDQCEIAAQQTAMLTEQSLQLQQALQADSAEFSKATENLQKYQMQLEQVSEASSNIAGALRDTQAALDVAKAESLNYRSQIDRLLSGEDIIVDHKIVNAEEYRRQQEEAKKKQQQQSSGGGRNALADARAIWYHGAWGNGGDWYTPYSRQFGTAAANKVLWYFNHGYGYNFDFDTGGYTGEWNQGEGVSSHKNGKLAFLHQKELILNAQDTENILSAVSMVRSLANSAQASMNNINTAASSNINSIYNPVTEQRVDIQASFPNATDAEDIRQALIGLSDRAYQYAHRVI